VRALQLMLIATLSACSPSEQQARETELFITPRAFIVDGTEHRTPDEAAVAVQQKAPAVLVIASCSAMANKRVLDAMASLQGRHSARVLMSAVSPGVRGCPDSKPPEGATATK
jgi:hypothetical protein